MFYLFIFSERRRSRHKDKDRKEKREKREEEPPRPVSSKLSMLYLQGLSDHNYFELCMCAIKYVLIHGKHVYIPWIYYIN